MPIKTSCIPMPSKTNVEITDLPREVAILSSMEKHEERMIQVVKAHGGRILQKELFALIPYNGYSRRTLDRLLLNKIFLKESCECGHGKILLLNKNVKRRR